jgi:hypothetical protein
MSNVQTVEVKFFTLHKLFWCLVYDLMIIGALGVWVFVNVQILGHDVMLGNSVEQSDR